MPPREPKISRDLSFHGILSALWKPFLFLLCFALYLRTLCPAFLNDDSPETIAAGAILGLQHPPSYALDTLFVHLVSFLPLGGMAFRVDIASALLASTTALLLAQNILWCLKHFFFSSGRSVELSKDTALKVFCAMSGALLLAVSRTYWEKALTAKGGIYLLQALLIQALFYCFLRYEKEGDGSPAGRWLHLAVFFFAVGFTNHWQTQSVFLPVLVLFFLRSDAAKGTWVFPALRTWIRLLTFSILALSLLLFLPLRAHLHPAWNLGAPDTFSLFIKSLRRGYWDDREVGLVGLFFQVIKGRAHWGDLLHLARRILDSQGLVWGAHLVKDLTWPALVLAFLGALAPWSQPGKKVLLSVLLPFAFLSFILLISLWVRTNLPFGWILDNYLLPTNWMAAFLAAVGLFYAARALPPAGQALSVGSVFIFLFLMMKSDFPVVNLQNQTLCYDYGVNLLKSTPPNSLLFAEGEGDYFTLFYLQAVENRRRDVRMVPTFTLFEPWGVAQVERLQPELGLTASARAFPDPIARMVYASSEMVVKNQSLVPCAFSYFDGPFHRYYLAYHPSLQLRRSGLLLEIDSPASAQEPLLSLDGLRLRNMEELSNQHGSLSEILEVYRHLGIPTPSAVP